MSTNKPAFSGEALRGLFASGLEYLVDTGQRSVLFLDVMRQRGLQYREHIAETAPHVLNYEVELIVDGRTLRQAAWRLITSAARSWWLILVRVTGRESATRSGRMGRPSSVPFTRRSGISASSSPVLEPAASLAAIPKLLPPDEDERRAGLEAIRGVLSASAEISGEAAKRLDRVTELFGLAGTPQAKAS